MSHTAQPQEPIRTFSLGLPGGNVINLTVSVDFLQSNMQVCQENSDDKEICTPSDIRECDGNINAQVLPEKSRTKYEAAYLTYKRWQTSNNIKLTSENVLMVYFKELSQKYKPPTLWSTWSMMKTTLNQNEGINIHLYKQLKAFLKRESNGYKCNKSKVLSPEEIRKFLKEAPDNTFLVTKVALIFAISGACGPEELANIKLQDVQHQGEILVIKITNTKTRIPRTFIIEGEFARLVKNYKSLRPPQARSDRFLLNYQNGKCTVKVIGINRFGTMPKQIAEYLNLPKPSSYTGHSFRRTSATLLPTSGADLITLKRRGAWKTRTVAESYIEDSIFKNKRKIGRLIASSISDLQRSRDGGTSCTATDPLSFGVPATKKRKNVNMDSEDPDVQHTLDELCQTLIKTEATDYSEDEEFPMKDLNQYVVKTEPIECITDNKPPIENKLNPIESSGYMEEDIELKKNFLPEINHYEDISTQTTCTLEDMKALQDEIKRLKKENGSMKQDMLKLRRLLEEISVRFSEVQSHFVDSLNT